MLTERLKEKYGECTPIFTDEILNCYADCSKQYVFRLIKEAEQEKTLLSYSRGVYYLPKKAFFGCSSICADQVAEKKYIRDGDAFYGIFSGLSLLNQFGVTTQMPYRLEIVTNNEPTRKRKIAIQGSEYVLRKSRFEITKENRAAYMVLQLFEDLNSEDVLDDSSISKISTFLKENNVSDEELLSLALRFPAKVMKRLIKDYFYHGTL